MTDLKAYNNFQSSEMLESPIEKLEELRRMKERIKNILNDAEVKRSVQHDFIYTFMQLGLAQEDAERICENIFKELLSDKNLDQIEAKVFEQFKFTQVGEANLIDALNEKLKGRADLIFTQVGKYLSDVKGEIIDYGAGDGQVTQKLYNDLGLQIEGVDVRPYAAKEVTVPMLVFSGKHVDVEDKHYEAALVTNVLHHEKDNETILKELDRIVANRLVVIETVPVGKDKKEIERDKERTFMNDYLYNRLFHNADVPVPGTFETPEGWGSRFAKYGWKVKHSENLGEDQKTIKDTHHLLVFEK